MPATDRQAMLPAVLPAVLPAMLPAATVPRGSSVLASTLFEQVFGLPLHPLAVHAPVVLVPLTAVGGIAIAVWPRWSQRFGVLVAIAGFLAAASGWLAKESGEALAQVKRYPLDAQPHFSLGAVLPWLAGLLFLLVLALWLLDRGTPRDRPRPLTAKVAAVLVVLAAGAALVWTVRVGHSGAELVWGSTLG